MFIDNCESPKQNNTATISSTSKDTKPAIILRHRAAHIGKFNENNYSVYVQH